MAKKLFGEGRMLSVGPIFLPNRSQIEKSKKELAYMVPPETLTKPRPRADRSPVCQVLDHECNFHNRQLMRKAVENKLDIDKIKKSPENKKRKLLMNGLQSLIPSHRRGFSSLDSKSIHESSATVGRLTPASEEGPYKIVPEFKRYH
jgi:hypothetical protein